MLKTLGIITAVVVLMGILMWKNNSSVILSPVQSTLNQLASYYPLSIEGMRRAEYPGSPITFEATLSAKPSYNQYIVSYISDGYKIRALLTIPRGNKPAKGFPVIIFNHGYIPPEQYKTTERYGAYVDNLASAGYVVMKPDYRGNGESEGNPEGAYYSPAYTRDVLNALSSVKTLSYIDPNRIGMWGHSMGGNITLRAMVVSKEIKAGVIWGGVVASYQDMINNWRRSKPWQPSQREQVTTRPGRQSLIDQFGSPDQNSTFWNSISPINYVADISGPVQLHHGLADEEVPYEFSESLQKALQTAGKPVESYTYEGGNHNLSGSAFPIAMARTLKFFKENL